LDIKLLRYGKPQESPPQCTGRSAENGFTDYNKHSGQYSEKYVMEMGVSIDHENSFKVVTCQRSVAKDTVYLTQSGAIIHDPRRNASL
jgi:hypothetical protein